jgi:hypothetical protein
MNPDIATILEPIDQHFQAVLSETFTGFRSRWIVMTEPRSGVVFLNATP